MVCQRDIARLLARGLSGAEAGRLAVQELLELDRTGEGLLSEGDVQALAHGLQHAEDRADYGRLVGLYREVRFLVLEAEVAALECARLLAELERRLAHYLISARVASLSGLATIASPSEGPAGEPDAELASLQGYFRDCLSDVMDCRRLEEAYARRSGRTLSELLTDIRAAACIMASVLLAYLAVIDEASAPAGVSFVECFVQVVPYELRALLGPQQADDPLAEVRFAVEGVNAVIGELAARAEAGAPQLAPIAFEDLKPDEFTLSILHERIATGCDGSRGMGAKWWLADGQ